MEELDKEKLPEHVAIIMDGNGRWAKKRDLSRIFGHQKGAEVVREVVRFCREIGIKVLSLYTFSSENWSRPKEEIDELMVLLKAHLLSELPEMQQNNIQLTAIGNLEDLPPSVLEVLKDVMEKTKENSGMILNLALSYGGRQEIIRAIKKILIDLEKKKITPEDITEELFSKYLFTSGLKDPDLLIRTSGELRLSNFLLWQMAYTEIYVTDVLWPDFGKEELVSALKSYQSRERRFGLTSEQLGENRCF